MANVVLLKIAAMFLVICVGWVARRCDYLSGEATRLLSRLVVDVAFPALVFTQMLRSVDGPALRQDWLCPVLGAAVIAVAYLTTWPVAPLLANREQRHTALFLVAVPNWVFFPLPIAEALYGVAGVRATLLYNAGAQLMLWTLGLWVLQGGKEMRATGRNLLTNAGLWATAIGIAVALAFPAMRELETLKPGTASASRLAGGAVIQALAMVGSLTVPLSLLTIGVQLGELKIRVHRLSGTLWGVLAARLVWAPAVTIALVVAVAKFGAEIPVVPRMIGYLIATMPVAISCSVMAERFGGDAGLAAQGIFFSTFFSLATVPIWFYVIQRLGL